VSIDILHQQAAAFNEPPIDLSLLNAVQNYVFILNQQRQIVFASPNARDLSPNKRRKRLLGLRPGEIIDCIHASECQGGCGTSASCQYCGAIQAILTSLGGQPDLREFRFTRVLGCRPETLNLLVFATPLVHNNEVFSLLAVTDGSDPRSRVAMERLFAEQKTGPIELKPDERSSRTRARRTPAK
jgi:hypothetical protein